MKASYQQKLVDARGRQKQIKKSLKAIKKLRKGEADALIHSLHNEAFEQINCLDCANCCKTTGPLFSQKDITRIAKELNLKESEFIKQYLKVDEDNDHVLNTLPCPFLDDQNYCSIYEFRPKACREFPHTDRVNQQGILRLTEKNALICPAVADIFENINV
jgi:Fe-S-cluster containining protein